MDLDNIKLSEKATYKRSHVALFHFYEMFKTSKPIEIESVSWALGIRKHGDCLLVSKVFFLGGVIIGSKIDWGDIVEFTEYTKNMGFHMLKCDLYCM